MEKIEALKKIRNASILSLVGISGGLLALIISSSLDAQEGMLGYYNDPLILIDLALFCFLTWGLFYRNSIICAVILLLYTTVSRIFFYIEFEEVSYQLIWIPLFAYFYIQAIRGALIIRQIEGVENKKLSIWSRILLGVLALVFIPLVTLGALIEIGVFLPGAEIREGKDLTWEEITLLRDNLLIEEKEEIVYFFSAGWRSILEDGSIITDKRVISYYQEIEGDSKGEVFNWYLYYD